MRVGEWCRTLIHKSLLERLCVSSSMYHGFIAAYKTLSSCLCLIYFSFAVEGPGCKHKESLLNLSRIVPAQLQWRLWSLCYPRQLLKFLTSLKGSLRQKTFLPFSAFEVSKLSVQMMSLCCPHIFVSSLFDSRADFCCFLKDTFTMYPLLGSVYMAWNS